jgi:hypothetical protein
VAVLEISQAIKGAEGLTHLRVGLLPCQLLAPGTEVCLFLFPHFQEPFCVMPRQFGHPHTRDNNPNFDGEIKRYQEWARFMKEPVESLRSRDADVRFVTTALLSSRYRSFIPDFHSRDRKTEPIDAVQSRLMLEVLAEADWEKAEARHKVPVAWLFQRLAPAAANNWGMEDDDRRFEPTARQWCKEHAATYRIRAFVQE